MRQRHVSGTNLGVSEIGYGCYILSGAYGPTDVNRVKATIRKAYELGVTFFDTADAYGQGEAVLGEVSKGFRHQVAIATKVGPTAGGGMDLTADRLQSACDASLKALDTDYIDLYQVHYDDPKTSVEETISGLKHLQREGKIRYFGVGHLPADRVQQYLAGGATTVLCELSAVERMLYLRTCSAVEKHRAGVLGFSVTGRGLLTGKIKAGDQFTEGDIRRIDPLFRGEALLSALRVADLLGQVGVAYGRTSAQVAIAWVLAQSSIISALTGPSSIAHLEENLGGAGGWLAASDLRQIDSFLMQEEAKLGDAQISMVKHTLHEPLPDNLEQALHQLVAAMESMMKYGLAEEASIVPIFTDLYRRRKGGLSMELIRSTQLRLAEL